MDTRSCVGYYAGRDTIPWWDTLPRTAMGRTHPRTDATAAAFSCSATQCGVAAAVVPIASCCISHNAPRAAATLPQTRSSLPSAPAACSTRRSSAPPRRMPPRTPATHSRTTYNVHVAHNMQRAPATRHATCNVRRDARGRRRRPHSSRVAGEAALRNTRLVAVVRDASGVRCTPYAVYVRLRRACVQAYRRPAPLVRRAAHRRCRATVAERAPFALRVRTHSLHHRPTVRRETRTARESASSPRPSPATMSDGLWAEHCAGEPAALPTAHSSSHSSSRAPSRSHPLHSHLPAALATYGACVQAGLSPRTIGRVLRFASRSAPRRSPVLWGAVPPCDAPRAE